MSGVAGTLGSTRCDWQAGDELRAANEKRQRTIETRQRLEREDVLLLRRRGLVPLAIADELGISLRRVVEYLEEAGEEIPGYLTTWNEPPREPNLCRHCGAARTD